MRISDRIYLVGSGALGMRLTHPYDCNVYLIDGGNEAALIDAGSGLDPERIVQEIERDGIAPEKLRYVLLTHAHGDHAAGANFWQQNFDCKVLCASEAAPWIEAADESKFSLDIAREAGIYPPDFVFTPCPIVRSLNDDEEICVGDITLKVLNTSGHARGHVSFYWEARKALFAGDIIFPGGRIAPQMTWDFSILETKTSIAKLHALQIEELYSGHRAPLLSQAHEDIQIAHEFCERLQFPPFLH
jgi:glyoxylase-like metal-dependent hydrolase (beta-lactamase superfamily II)